MKNTLLTILLILFLVGCSKNEPAPEPTITRNFKMGFSTWPFGPTTQDREETYSFVQSNGDIYSEQIDDRIPWHAWINDLALPSDFVNNIDYRVSKIDENLTVVLSISPLNTDRNNLIADWDNQAINYELLSDKVIEDAYFKHVEYLVSRFNPSYLISAMEVNDLLVNAPEKWEEYQELGNNIRSRLKSRFPSLLISESITLHNFFQPQVENPSAYIAEVTSYIDQLDFAAISFYPFFKNQREKAEYQEAFDFLHQQTDKSIGFVETNQLSEDLIIPNFNTNIIGNTTQQKEYLESLLFNAEASDYEFIIWWAHRDYDALWETFPEAAKDIGQVWRDTGILDETGNERPAYATWVDALQMQHTE